MANERQVSEKEAQDLAKEMQCTYFEIRFVYNNWFFFSLLLILVNSNSAKTSNNVEETFHALVWEALCAEVIQHEPTHKDDKKNANQKCSVM